MTTVAPLFDVSQAAIDQFRGPWRFLSNFFDPAVLTYEGLEYRTSEAAFNAAKTVDPQVRAWIAAAPTAVEAKRRGNDHTRTVLRPGWDETVRFQVMAEVLKAKFTTHPARTDRLLSTGQRVLIEGNIWHDQVWGDCTCGRQDCNKPGANALGFALMRLRQELSR
ncbi:NADAR family protein [Tessaracoccus sp.]